MADGNEMAAVETSVANPKQEVNVLENMDKVTSYTTPTTTLETNPTQFKNEQNESFFDSEAWKDYKSNILRAYSNRYPGFTSIEKVAENDVWRDSLGANSDFVVKRAQALAFTYKHANGFFGKMGEAYNAQRFGLRAAAARKDLSDAIRDGDEFEIAKAKIKYEQEKRRVYERGNPYKEYGNTLMSLAASSARNPETIPINIIGGVASAPTGGASLVAAQAVNAAIVGTDTYRLETGSALEQLDELDTDLTEEQKFQKARKAGITNALVEAGLFGIGGNVAARGARTLGKAGTRYIAKKGAEKITGTEITKEASKSLLKTEFIKALQNPEKQTIKDIVKQYGKDTLFGGLGEGAQEVFQDSVTEAMLRSIQSGKGIREELLDDWADFITDPFGYKHADKWETFANILLATPIFSAGFNSISAASEISKTNRGSKGVDGAAEKFQGAINNDLGLSEMFQIQGEANAKNGTPVSNAVLQEQIRRGEISGKLYTTEAQIEKMREDPEVAEALEQMGVAQALENASENGGVVELDFLKYDEIVNQTQNQVLFQKMRNYLSFSETTMSMEEYNQFIRDSGKQVANKLSEEIRKDENSFFNRLKKSMMEAGRDEAEAEGNAAIIHFALTNAEGMTKDKKNDIVDRLRVRIEGKNGADVITTFNNAIANSVASPDGSRVVNMGDKNETAISFNKVARGKNKGKYTVGITDNTGLSSVMKDTGGWSTAEEKATPALFDSEESARQAVETMYAKTDGNGVDLDVGAAFNDVFTETPDGETKVYHMFVGSRLQDTTNSVADSLGKRKELDEARSMYIEAINKGVEPDLEDIWAKTGWYFNEDGSWSYEISDAEAPIDMSKFVTNKNKVYTGVHTTLGKVWDNKELFKVAPWAKEIYVHVGQSNITNKKNTTSIAKFSRFIRNGKKEYEIIISATKFAEAIKRGEDPELALKSEFVHEVQHAIQYEMDMMYTNSSGSQILQPLYKSDLTEEQKTKIEELYKLRDSVYKKKKKYNVYLERQIFGINSLFGNRNKILSAAQTEEEKQIVNDFVDKFIETKNYNYFAEDDYYRRSHELQARNSQYRLQLTEGQRKVVSPSSTKDIAGMTRVGYAPNKEQLYKQIREIRTIKFVGVPLETSTQTTSGQIEAGRTVARNGKYEIVLTPDANATTFAHEVFHMFSMELQRVYNNGTITDYWKKQAEKMFKLAEAEVIEGQPVILTESQEEKLANMFTTYIMKGKIENREVRGLLAKLIEMFKTVYQQSETRDLTEKALNKTAYDFFNSVITSQDMIEEIQRNAGLLEIAEPEGVDRELYDYYIANLAISKIEASNDLRAKMFAIDTFRKSAEYTKLLQEYKDEAIESLADTVAYKIVAQSSLFTENKLEQTTLWAQNNFPELKMDKGKVSDILKNTKPLEQAATEEANEEMENYIAKKFRISREDMGFKEERNRAKVRALLAESVMQRGGTIKDIEEEIKKAENASDKHLGRISVNQIMETDKWKNRETAAVQRYVWAKNNDRQDLMSAERFNQAVINLIMIKANGFKSEYQKLTSLFEKLQEKQKKYQRKDDEGKPYGPLEHRYHAEDWELLRSISENFGNKIRDKRRSNKSVHEQLKDWISMQVANRFTTVAGLEEYIPFIDRGHDGSILSMKGKDFKKLWAVMGTINSVAMREQQIYLDGEYAELNKYVDETIKFFHDMNIDTEGKGMFGTSGKFLGKYGTWTNPEPLAKAIFPPEVFRKIFLPMFQGATLSESQAKQWIDEWNKSKRKIDTSTKEFVLEDGSTITYGSETEKVMTYGDVANLLLAMGSEHSYKNYLLKFGLTEEQAYKIASQAIKRNKNYVDFMNTTWKVYGEATEGLNKSFQERNNELFVKKEHRAFDIDGIHFEGGYVPEDKHYQALVRELGSWNQDTGTTRKKKWKNEEIITKAEDGDILPIIDITEMKLSQSAKWIHAAIPYNNIKKFLENKQVSDTIGDNIFNFFKTWLQNWDTPHFDESGMWRPLSRMTTLSALGMRASTALLQVSGIVQAVARLNPVYVGRGILQFISEGGFYKPFKIQEQKSDYMTSRVANPFANKMGMDIEGATFKEMFDKYNAKSSVGKVGAAILTAYQRVGMSMIQLVDGWVATITWNAAYARAKDNGLTDEEAKLEADSEVRITQSDAMQISRSAAMQEPWARAVTAFGTWTMGMRSQSMALTTSKKYRPELIAWTCSWVVVASFIEAFLKDLTEPADDGDEDKEMLERVMNSWYNKIVEAVGTQALPFAGLGSTAAKMIARGLEPEDDEKIFKVFAGGSVSALQYASRVAESAEKLIDYMQTGEEEQRDKFFITSSGLISNNLKKHLKKVLEDN